MRRFCEVSCVKYCVLKMPLVVTAVQNHGGVQSALHSIHAPTRDEEGTYIRASVASDVATLSTPNTPSHQGMTMNIFLLGGWVARPSAFCFMAFPCSPCLRCWLCFAWSPVFYVVCFACSLCFILLPCLFQLVALTFNRTLSNVGLPVLGMPSISALLGYYSPLIHLILHTYSLDNIQFTCSPC